MEIPACRVTLPTISTKDYEEAVYILLPATQKEAEAISSGQSMNEGFDHLSQGDLYAVCQIYRDCLEGEPWFSSVACDAADKRACFVDRLFGTRGETRTTVVQWSKGTIF